ncbi:MAG: phosphoserine phosphatase SerB [Alphaproteobacteria bacterium]|nr:phosphoserine phosphatase SerB [Alphaproteobacteria bacterium]
MTHVLVLIAPPTHPPLDAALVSAAVNLIAQTGASVGAPVWLSPGEAVDLPFTGDAAVVAAAARVSLSPEVLGRPIDHAVVAVAGRRKRLLVADMDSTILQGETLDELAVIAGVGEAVAAITTRSMRGELDFAGALRERVGMLAGLDTGALLTTAAGMRLMPGAKALVRTMRAHGAVTALATGGFTYFSAIVRDWVGFTLDRANTLLEADGRLTGKVGEPVFGRESKLETLQSLAAQHGIPAVETMAVGDGANDLAMIQAAGLGVAYHAKPVVAAAAAARIDHGDLTGLLFLQGYSVAEWTL